MPLLFNPADPEKPADLTLDNIYKVVLNGVYAGQDVLNILYYRANWGGIGLPDFLGSAEDVAAGVKSEVWDTPAMKSLMSTSYTLRDITVTPYDNNFDLGTSSPFVLSVNENGTRGGSSVGPAHTSIVRFNLNPVNIFTNFMAPKRSYVAIGPILETDVPDSGVFTNTTRDMIYDAMVGLAATLPSSIPLLGDYVPTRIKTVRVGGVITLNGWADVNSITVNEVASFRRSRLPEG